MLEDCGVTDKVIINDTSNCNSLHTIVSVQRKNLASKYLGYYMNSDEYHNQLRPYMKGIKVTSISKEYFEKMFLLFLNNKKLRIAYLH